MRWSLSWALAAVTTLGFAAPPDDSGPTTTAPSDADGDHVPASEPQAADVILPCGLRLIAAEDDSLPVTAIVLAVDVGTEDDPEDQPGLIHALAYHLLQGNRQLSPLRSVTMVHDGGGLSGLAIGPAQVRYENLIPSSLLGDVLWLESQRLRAPNVDESLWRATLAQAAKDRPRKWSYSPEVRAAVHNQPGLAHDPATVSPALRQLQPAVVSAQLAKHFTYDRATLIVVGPTSPAIVVGTVMALFADLPPRSRHPFASVRLAGDRTTATPQVASAKGQGAFIWPLGHANGAQLWAQVLCDAINGQKRAPNEPSAAKLRCRIEDDPRRGLIIMRASGVDDPNTFIEQRLGRLRHDPHAALTLQAQRLRDDLAMELHTPLALARHLARVDPSGLRATPHDTLRPLAELTGAAELALDRTPLSQSLTRIDTDHATIVVAPTKETAP